MIENIKNLDIYSALLRSAEVREEEGLIFIWAGGHTCNIYNQQGKEVDMFSFGDFANNNATLVEFNQAVNNYLSNL